MEEINGSVVQQVKYDELCSEWDELNGNCGLKTLSVKFLNVKIESVWIYNLSLNCWIVWD